MALIRGRSRSWKRRERTLVTTDWLGGAERELSQSGGRRSEVDPHFISTPWTPLVPACLTKAVEGPGPWTVRYLPAQTVSTSLLESPSSLVPRTTHSPLPSILHPRLYTQIHTLIYPNPTISLSFTSIDICIQPHFSTTRRLTFCRLSSRNSVLA